MGPDKSLLPPQSKKELVRDLLIGFLFFLLLTTLVCTAFEIAEYERHNGPLFNRADSAELAAVARTMQQHLDQSYPGMELVVSDVRQIQRHRFVAMADSASWLDTRFELTWTAGTVTDDYEPGKTERAQLEVRISNQYRDWVFPVLKGFAETVFPELNASVGGGVERSGRGYQSISKEPHTCGMSEQDVVFGKEYSQEELSQWGNISLHCWLPNDQVTTEHVARLLLALRDHCDERGIAFHTVTLTLIPEIRPDLEDQIHLYKFHRDLIEEENLVARIEESLAHYSAWDNTQIESGRS